MPAYINEIGKKSWKKTIRKVILAVVLWAVALIRIYAYGNNKGTTETLVNAFHQVQLNDMSASVDAFGYYADVYLSEKAKETLVRDIGYALGLNYCDITTEHDGELAVTTLTKNGKYAVTQIKMITREEKLSENVLESHQYLSINIDLGNNLSAAMEYQKVLKNLYADFDIDADVTVNLTGNLDGQADLALKNLISNQIIDQMEAKIVAENRTEDIYTIYAYTSQVDDSIKVSGKKINLNISASYDEQKNKTFFYISTPIINTDY